MPPDQAISTENIMGIAGSPIVNQAPQRPITTCSNETNTISENVSTEKTISANTSFSVNTSENNIALKTSASKQNLAGYDTKKVVAANVSNSNSTINQSTPVRRDTSSQFVESTMSQFFKDDDISIGAFERSAKEMISVIKKSSALTRIDPFNWAQLEKIYESIFNDYCNEMEAVIGEFHELMKQRQVWQEVAFSVDRERSTERINKMEQWITLKESNLDSVKTELKNSIEVIQKLFEQIGPSSISNSS